MRQTSPSTRGGFCAARQIEDAERRLYEWHVSALDGGSALRQALTVAAQWRRKVKRDANCRGIRDRHARLEHARWGGMSPPTSSSWAGSQEWAHDALAPTIAYKGQRAHRRRGPGRRHHEVDQWRHRRLSSLRNGPPNSSPSRIMRPNATGVQSRTIRRGGITRAMSKRSATIR